jgi:hypothetical protein
MDLFDFSIFSAPRSLEAPESGELLPEDSVALGASFGESTDSGPSLARSVGADGVDVEVLDTLNDCAGWEKIRARP